MHQLMSTHRRGGPYYHMDCLLSATDRTSAAIRQASMALDKMSIDEKLRVEIDRSFVIKGACVEQCARHFL